MDRGIEHSIRDSIPTSEVAPDVYVLTSRKDSTLLTSVILDSYTGDADHTILSDCLRAGWRATRFEHMRTILSDDSVWGAGRDEVTALQEEHAVAQGADSFHRMRDKNDRS